MCAPAPPASRCFRFLAHLLRTSTRLQHAHTRAAVTRSAGAALRAGLVHVVPSKTARMSDAQDGAGGGAGGDVPDSAPSLREVADAPAGEALRTYDTQLGADELLKQFLAEISDVAREAEVLRVLSCFKLNPYEHLNLRFDSSVDDVKRQYRKISLMVHPDKCKHPRAREAFEVLGKAQNMVLDEEFRKDIGAHLARSRELVLRDWYKAAKDDVVLRVRHGGSREAMEAAFVPSEEFQERWKVKTRELMAEFEWRKRRMVLRIKDEEARVTAGEKEAHAETRAKHKEHREWDKEERREKRVGGWRDFMSTQKSKKKKGELAGYQGPKLRPEEKKEAQTFGGPKDERRVERPDEVSRAW